MKHKTKSVTQSPDYDWVASENGLPLSLCGVLESRCLLRLCASYSVRPSRVQQWRLTMMEADTVQNIV